jgi:hypothetical protein
MAWTTPRTWVDGENVTAAIMNAHIRDNLSDLDTRLSALGGGDALNGLLLIGA